MLKTLRPRPMMPRQARRNGHGEHEVADAADAAFDPTALLGRISDIARDLTKLEVNTILKETISGEKMPKSRHALINIAQGFCDELGQMGFSYPPKGTLFKGSYAVYHGLRERAKEAIQLYEEGRIDGHGSGRMAGFEDRDLYLLYRIRDFSSQVHEIMTNVLRRLEAQHGLALPSERREVLAQAPLPAAVAATTEQETQFLALKKLAYNDYTREELTAVYPPFNLAPDELTTLRKIWEIGTEEIAMQTVVQLDGDVITRITPHHLTRKEADDILHRMHNESIGISMRYWETLVHVAASFFEILVGRQRKAP